MNLRNKMIKKGNNTLFDQNYVVKRLDLWYIH